MWVEVSGSDTKNIAWSAADIIANELGGGWVVTKEDPEISGKVTVARINNSKFDTSMTISADTSSVYLYYICGGKSIEATSASSTANGANGIIGVEIYKSPKGTTFAIGFNAFLQNSNNKQVKYIVAKNAKNEDAILTSELPTTDSRDANKTRISVVKNGIVTSYNYPSIEVNDDEKNSNLIILNKMFDWHTKCMYEEIYEIRMCPRTSNKIFEISGKKYIAITNNSKCYGGLAFQVANYNA